MKEKMYSFLSFLLSVMTFLGVLGVLFSAKPFISETFLEIANHIFSGGYIVIEKLHSFLTSTSVLLVNCVASLITIFRFLGKVFRAVATRVKRFSESESQPSETPEQSVPRGTVQQPRTDVHSAPTFKSTNSEGFIQRNPYLAAEVQRLERWNQKDSDRLGR